MALIGSQIIGRRNLPQRSIVLSNHPETGRIATLMPNGTVELVLVKKNPDGTQTKVSDFWLDVGDAQKIQTLCAEAS